jgi:hypothetical protein
LFLVCLGPLAAPRQPWRPHLPAHSAIKTDPIFGNVLHLPTSSPCLARCRSIAGLYRRLRNGYGSGGSEVLVLKKLRKRRHSHGTGGGCDNGDESNPKP